MYWCNASQGYLKIGNPPPGVQINYKRPVGTIFKGFGNCFLVASVCGMPNLSIAVTSWWRWVTIPSSATIPTFIILSSVIVKVMLAIAVTTVPWSYIKVRLSTSSIAEPSLSLVNVPTKFPCWPLNLIMLKLWVINIVASKAKGYIYSIYSLILGLNPSTNQDFSSARKTSTQL